MNSKAIRQKFLDFFASKQHKIVPSAPMVIKNDPTLMFTNAGMNQFKDIFLGNSSIEHKRVADAQKCLRVSGKHNDLEEVGHDTYHHTMFEMLGNWSFGDYFKHEAIDYAWELLTEVFEIDKTRLYVTVFEGDKQDGIESDEEAKKIWLNHIDQDRILYGNKKDNFWEMGDTGPCGPCSEIHVDLRSNEQRYQQNAVELINKDHPLVIEIWNLVFIQFNRKANGQLESLPMKHVDTGMGFERLCMVVQGKKSNYDTDIFQTIIQEISVLTGKKYGENQKNDIAMRVIADHLRTIAFAIADGQLPSNNKAGYVIRRILRRAVRYAYTFLHVEEPFLTGLVPVLIQVMGEAYPELKQQQQIIEKVLHEEEESFLRTLSTGVKMLDDLIKKAKTEKKHKIKGRDAFVMYDSYGFPLDLTQLIAKENGLQVDIDEFNKEMKAQQDRSRTAAAQQTEDWDILKDIPGNVFIGYENTECQVEIVRYRKVSQKKKTVYQLVFDKTPFYAESGGQVGDTGFIEKEGNKINIIDTQKEHNLILHVTKELPENLSGDFKAVVNSRKREFTACNHSATHLLHQALRLVLGEHVEQKGSLVDEKRLRFDFSHFEKLSKQEIAKIEAFVNHKIRQNINLEEKRDVPMSEAQKMGALALFGEKYGNSVRVIKFGDSVELCGGTHVSATGEIGVLKITSESAIAAGIRRIEAVTAAEAEAFVNKKLETLDEIKHLFKTSKNLVTSVKKLMDENLSLQKQVEHFEKQKTAMIKTALKKQVKKINGINVIATKVEVESANQVKDLMFQLRGEMDNIFVIVGADINGKANLSIMISDDVVTAKDLHAGNIIRQAAKEINGGGGGQPFFASAGGKNPQGIDNAIDKALNILKDVK